MADSNNLTSLKQKLEAGRTLVAPGVYDAMTALVAEQSGFEALYLSGAAVAYNRLARSDIGLCTFPEMMDTLHCISDRVSTPIIVDADTGFGGPINVQRTVRGFERAGASMIQIEDQSFPKRCGQGHCAHCGNVRQVKSRPRRADGSFHTDYGTHRLSDSRRP